MKFFEEAYELELRMHQPDHKGYYRTCGYLECYMKSSSNSPPYGLNRFVYRGEYVMRVFEVIGSNEGPVCDVYTASQTNRMSVPDEAVSIHIRQSSNSTRRPNAIFFDKNGKALPYNAYGFYAWPPLTKVESWLYEKIHSFDKYFYNRRKLQKRDVAVR